MSDDIKKKLGVDDTHQKMYDELFAEMVNQTVEMVASVLVALGLRLYRSCLPQEEFAKLVQVFADNSKDIRPFQEELQKKILH